MDLDVKQLTIAIKSIAEEKNLSEENVNEIIKSAMIAAYHKDFGESENEIKVNINLNKGEIDLLIQKEVANELTNNYQISIDDAKNILPTSKIGDLIFVPESVQKFGRVAAQIAKQVILQKLREEEKEVIFSEFEHKIGTIVNANVSRIENGLIKVDLGKAQGIMPRSEQIQNEHLYPGQRIKVLIKEISKDNRGPQLIVSRASSDFILKLFANEVPELESGAVKVQGIAREAGVRTKIAVSSDIHGIDPVGTFVGGHGIRVNAVMSEVGEQEKIDILVYSADIKEFIKNALSPTQINKIELNNKDKTAKIFVNEDQLSIAIGKGGQNVRLASKLVGLEIDIIKSERNDSSEQANKIPDENEKLTQKPVIPKLKKKTDLENSLLEAIESQD